MYAIRSYYGTSVFMGPGYSSTHVALVNRLHCTLRAMLTRSSEMTTDWVRHVPEVVRAYNDCPHPGTGFSPTELMLGWRTKDDIDVALGLRLRDGAQDIDDYLVDRITSYNVCYTKLLRADCRTNFCN